MPIITCPECGKQFSSFADNCPACGYPTELLTSQITEDEQMDSTKVVGNEKASSIKESKVGNSSMKIKQEYAICPGCGALGEVGSRCPFCGVTIRVPEQLSEVRKAKLVKKQTIPAEEFAEKISKYGYVGAFQKSGVAIVSIGSLHGLINRNGDLLIPLQYEDIQVKENWCFLLNGDDYKIFGLEEGRFFDWSGYKDYDQFEVMAAEGGYYILNTGFESEHKENDKWQSVLNEYSQHTVKTICWVDFYFIKDGIILFKGKGHAEPLYKLYLISVCIWSEFNDNKKDRFCNRSSRDYHYRCGHGYDVLRYDGKSIYSQEEYSCDGYEWERFDGSSSDNGYDGEDRPFLGGKYICVENNEDEGELWVTVYYKANYGDIEEFESEETDLGLRTEECVAFMCVR